MTDTAAQIRPIQGERSRSWAIKATPALGRQRPLLLYLSGSVKKGKNDERDPGTFWTDEDERTLIGGIEGIRVQTLNPSKTQLQRSDYYANFGCDLHLVNVSDAVLVDARTKKGVGVGAEMMFAKFVGVPVITICPQGCAYRRALVPDVFGEDLHDWTHPFIYGLSDYIVDTLDDAIDLINCLGADGLSRRDRTDVFDAIEYYNRARECFERPQ